MLPKIDVNCISSILGLTFQWALCQGIVYCCASLPAPEKCILSEKYIFVWEIYFHWEIYFDRERCFEREKLRKIFWAADPIWHFIWTPRWDQMNISIRLDRFLPYLYFSHRNAFCDCWDLNFLLWYLVPQVPKSEVCSNNRWLKEHFKVVA